MRMSLPFRPGRRQVRSHAFHVQHFPVRFPAGASCRVLRHSRPLSQFDPPRREPAVLRVGTTVGFAAPSPVDRRQLLRRPCHRPSPRGRQAGSLAAARRDRLQSRVPGNREVHVFRAGQPELGARVARSGRNQAGSVRPPARHLLFHVPRDLLSRRHLSAQGVGATEYHRLRPLHRVVSAAHRRPHHPLSRHRGTTGGEARDHVGLDRGRRHLHRRSRRRSSCSPTSSACTRIRPFPRTPATSLRRRRGSASFATPGRSTSTSPDTPTWREGCAGCSDFASSTISTIRTSRSRCRNSGDAGTSRCRTGSATISTFRSAETAWGRAGPPSISSSYSCCAGFGTAPSGVSSCGACTTERS